MPTKNIRLKSIGASVASDGEVAYRFQRSDGVDQSFSVPFIDLAAFVIQLEAKAGEALAMLNAASKGSDRRLMTPVRKRSVTNIQVAGSKDALVLTLELDGRLALDMALSEDQVRDTIQSLQAFLNRAHSARPKSN